MLFARASVYVYAAAKRAGTRPGGLISVIALSNDFIFHPKRYSRILPMSHI
jgi:hypothetical protein